MLFGWFFSKKKSHLKEKRRRWSRIEAGLLPQPRVTILCRVLQDLHLQTRTPEEAGSTLWHYFWVRRGVHCTALSSKVSQIHTVFLWPCLWWLVHQESSHDELDHCLSSSIVPWSLLLIQWTIKSVWTQGRGQSCRTWSVVVFVWSCA